MNTQEAIGLLNYMLRDIENDASNDKNAIEAQALTHAIEHMKRGAPKGWQLFPIDPIAPQIMAGIHCLEKNDDLSNIGYGPKAVQIYKSMNGAYHE